MKVGIINSTNRFAVDRFEERDIELVNFEISLKELSVIQIMHSAFATPARYVMEIYRRLRDVRGPGETGEGCFIFNPLFVMNREVVQEVVYNLRHRVMGCDKMAVLCGMDNIPLGYYFPNLNMTEEVKYLTLLSTVDAELDRRFLSMFFCRPAVMVKIPSITLLLRLYNDFLYGKGYHDVCKWTAETALGILRRKAGVGEDFSPEKDGPIECMKLKAVRDSIPITAIMPYHAGDILFLAIAATNTKSHITQILTDRKYADIIRDVAPPVKPLVIDSTIPYRGGNEMQETDYFATTKESFPGECFYYYFRPSRDYNNTRFHLIDHCAFALGESFLDGKDLLINRKPGPGLFAPEVRDGKIKVLFHCGAGWPLKVYPMEWRERLIDLLHSRGFEVTLFTDREEPVGSDKYRHEHFKDLHHLKKLLKSHHLLIGMDSFPCHYAAHVLGLPTICLFASTKPVNSNARPSDYYLDMEKGLDCRPCGWLFKCKENKKEYCENFADPEMVFDEAVKMIENIYLKRGAKGESGKKDRLLHDSLR